MGTVDLSRCFEMGLVARGRPGFSYRVVAGGAAKAGEPSQFAFCGHLINLFVLFLFSSLPQLVYG